MELYRYTHMQRQHMQRERERNGEEHWKKIFKAEYFKKVKDTEGNMKLIHLVYIIG